MILAQVSFLAAITSTPHCLGMCGGLASAAQSDLKKGLLYQLGRLSGYLLLALIVSSTGALIDQTLPPFISTIATSIIALFLIYTGLLCLKNRPLATHLPLGLGQKLFKRTEHLNKGSYLIGLSSIFLPCGLLYTFLAALALIHNPFKAMIAMLIFWATTATGLIIIPQMLRQTVNQLGGKFNTFQGLFFMLLGLSTLVLKFWPHSHTLGPICH